MAGIGQLIKDRKHEPNPYRPDLPEDLRDISSNLFDHMRENAETLREQHNVTQAGDSTFSWEILTEVDLEARYNVGSLGRFYHKQFGIIQARYCRFSKLLETDWLGSPLGLMGDADPLTWTVTNNLSLSSADSIVGLGGFYVLPPEGSYGWVIVNGANVQALGLRKRTPVKQGDQFVWGGNFRATTADSAKGKVFGKIVGDMDFELIQGDGGAGDYFLATPADRTKTEEFQRFQPLFWTTNFPSTMIASLTTDGETLIVDAEFTKYSDLCGFIWESEDKWDHPLTAYDTNIDYSNCVLSFTMQIEGDTLTLEDNDGPVLTIEGKDGFGAPHIWYVRLWNYVTSGSNVNAQIVLDFDNLAGGFGMDDPVTPTEIDRMFISIVPASYDADNTDPLPTKEVCRVKLSNITTTGSNANLVAGTGTGVNELRMTNGYDDTYNLCPERLIRNVWQLGYRKWFNHYVGMSHYFSWEWDAGESRFIAQDLENPLNGPCQIWHTDLCKRLEALDFTVIFSISYEMLNSFIPAAWRQLDSDGLPALTGWEPPSSLFSPVNVAGNAYLDRVFVSFADILAAAELPIHMQVGEPWWWVDFRDFKPYFYDAETVAKWESETGLTTPIMTDMTGAKNTEEIQYLNWLGDRLAESTLHKIAVVRDKYPDMVSYFLVYLPQILSGFAGTPDTPDVKRVNMPVGWAKPAFDILQLEDYDFVINNEPHLSEAGRLLAEERLGYPREEQQYFAGFVLFKEDEQIWEYTSYAIRQGWEFGVPEVFVWAYTQVMRDGYVNLLTSDSAFRQWQIPPGYAMVEHAAQSEKQVKDWIDDKVSVATAAIPSLEADIKTLKGSTGISGLTVRIQAAEDNADNLATLISRESENRSRSQYVINGRLTNLEQSLSGGVAAGDFLNLQGIVNSLQGDFNSYVGFNNQRVDVLQTQMESVLAYGNLNAEIQSLRDADTSLADRITEFSFWQLYDLPAPADVTVPYAGLALQVPRVKLDESGMEYYTPLALPAGGTTGQILQKYGGGDGEATWSDLTAGIVAFTPVGTIAATDVQGAIAELDATVSGLALVTTFLSLTDVPDSYTGHGLHFPRIKADGSGLEFVAVAQLPAGGATGTILQKYGAGDGEASWASLTAGITAFTPTGTIASTDVQSAIAEVSGDVTSLASTVAGKLDGAATDSGDALIPTLNSPWINYGGGFGGARYYKDATGRVTIEGLIQAAGGSPTSGVVLFTLLAGYRPPDTLMFCTYNGGGAGRIDVQSNGDVVMQSGNTAFTSLSGISFIVA